MPRTAGNYASLFQRIEETFDIEEMTAENLKTYLGVSTSNRGGLAEELAQILELSKDINKIKDVEELKQLKREILRQPIFRFKLLQKADSKIEQLEIEERERIIAESVTRVEVFAKKKKITLSESKIGRQEKWKGKPVLTIRDSRGRFISWRKQ